VGFFFRPRFVGAMTVVRWAGEASEAGARGEASERCVAGEAGAEKLICGSQITPGDFVCQAIFKIFSVGNVMEVGQCYG
jgi:hypothetical protein